MYLRTARANICLVGAGILGLFLRQTSAGISGFSAWFEYQFPEAVQPVEAEWTETFDHVCVDMNQILHPALRTANSEEHALKKIFAELNRVLTQCQPRASVVLAFDGPAPVAKLATQRGRRARTARKEGQPRSSKKKQSKKALALAVAARTQAAGEAPPSTLALTPGTAFMERVRAALVFFAAQRVAGKDPRYRGVTFYVSGAEVPGEGEVKIMDWLGRRRRVWGAARALETAVVVGGDADLVLQGLALEDPRGVTVLAPTTSRRKKGRATARAIDLWEVARHLEGLFPGQSARIRNDLIILLIMNGNDYVPKVRGGNFRRLFSRYVHTKSQEEFADRFLVDGINQTFDWGFAREFFSGLSMLYRPANYHDVLKPSAASRLNEAWSQKRFPGRDPDYDLFESPKKQHWFLGTLKVGGQVFEITDDPAPSLKAAKQRLAAQALAVLCPDLLPPEEGEEGGDAAGGNRPAAGPRDGEEEEEGWDGLSEGEESEATEEEEGAALIGEGALQGDGTQYSVEEYLKALLWCLQMYIDGFCPDFYFKYSLRFAPRAIDFAQWIDDAKGKPAEIKAPRSARPAPSPAVCCLALLPPSARALAPPALRHLLDEGSPAAGALREGALDLGRLMREVAAAAGPGADACDPAGAAWAAVTHVQNVENAAKVSKSKNFKPLEDQYLSIGYGFTDLSLYQASQAVVGTAKATSETPNHDWMHPMFAKVSESHNVLKLPYKKAFQKNKDDSSMPKSKIKEKDLQRRPEEQNEFAQAGPALPFSPGSSWQEVAGKSNEKTPPSMLMLSSQQIASSDISSRRNLNNNMCLKCYVKSVSSEASTLL